jgi:hypothetical protein
VGRASPESILYFCEVRDRRSGVAADCDRVVDRAESDGEMTGPPNIDQNA